MIKVVIDTNVLVSAILSPYGPAAEVLNAFLNGVIGLLYDDRIISEYEDVLGRKKFDFSEDLVMDILEYIKSVGEHVTASPINIKVIDPFDLPFIEVAVTGCAAAIITGNKKHFTKTSSGPQAVSPAEFIAKYL